jgi:ribosomal protein L37AE/L43A
MATVYCDNVERCPKCGELPNQVKRVWRYLSICCKCGKSYGAVGCVGFKNSEDVIKRAFQQWNDGARKDKGLRLDKCRFTVEV